VHLKVANLQRALDFYVGLLGFELVMRFGEQAAFVSAGGYHHHIGLNTRDSQDAPPPPRHSTGLYHVAILYPTRADLAAIAQRVIDAGIHIGASHHGVSEAIYLTDPDGNGIELYRDLPQEQWPRDANGNIQMVTEYLDVT
jgi:catechol 2,3-dioxygenase